VERTVASEQRLTGWDILGSLTRAVGDTLVGFAKKVEPAAEYLVALKADL
jgi:hypothetical protein